MKDEEKSFHSQLNNHQTEGRRLTPHVQSQYDDLNRLSQIKSASNGKLSCALTHNSNNIKTQIVQSTTTTNVNGNIDNNDINTNSTFESVSVSACRGSRSSSSASSSESVASQPPSYSSSSLTTTNTELEPPLSTITSENHDHEMSDTNNNNNKDEETNTSTKMEQQAHEKEEELVIELRFLVRRREAGALIGKRGTHIKRLRETFRSSMFSIPDTGNGPERVVCITTNEQSLDSILADFTQLLMEKSPENDDQIELKLLIHSSHAGSLIGIAGQSIKKLRNDSKAAIKIYEMCCPLSNERICAIKAKPPVVVTTIKLIQNILKDNPVKGTTKPYDALHFDLNLVDKYGGYFPDDSSTPCVQQQVGSHAGLNPTNPMMRHYCEPNLVYGQHQHHYQRHHQQQQHQQQHQYQHPRHQAALMHSMGLDLGITYQEKHCSVWRAPSKRGPEFNHRPDISTVCPENPPDVNNNTLPDSSPCPLVNASIKQDSGCMDVCKSTAQQKALKSLPAYYHHQAAARLADRFHPYATPAASLEHHHNQHLYHNARFSTHQRLRTPYPFSPHRQHYQPNPAQHQIHRLQMPNSTNYMRFAPAFQHQPCSTAPTTMAGLFHQRAAINAANAVAAAAELRCERHLRPCLCMFLPTITPEITNTQTTPTGAGPFVQLVKNYKSNGINSGNSYNLGNISNSIVQLKPQSLQQDGIETGIGATGTSQVATGQNDASGCVSGNNMNK